MIYSIEYDNDFNFIILKLVGNGLMQSSDILLFCVTGTQRTTPTMYALS
jgi:hypothetical protein